MFRYICSYLKPYKFQVGQVLFFASLGSLLEGISAGLLIPLISALGQQNIGAEVSGLLRYFVRVFSGYSFIEQFVLALIAITVAVLIKNACLVYTHFLGADMQTKVVADARRKGIDLLLDVGLYYFSSIKAGDIA